MVKVLGIILLIYALITLYYGIIIKSYNIDVSKKDEKLELNIWEAFLWPVYVVVAFIANKHDN